MDATTRINRLLDQYGAELVRETNHRVYRLPNQKTFVRSKSPSPQTELNALSNLRKLLDLPKEATAPRTPKLHKKTNHIKQTYFGDPTPLRDTFRAKLIKAVSPEKADSSILERLVKEAVPESEPLPARIPEPTPPVVAAPAPKRHYRKSNYDHCFSYPPEVLAEANRIMNQSGQEACNQYLKQHREEVVEVLRVPVTEEENMNSLETKVEQARHRIVTLQQETTSAELRIKKDQELVTKHKLEIDQLSTFITAYDLAQNEAKIVEKLLGETPKVTTTLVSVNINRGDLIERAKPLLAQQGGASTRQIYEHVRKTFPNATIQQVHSALQYEIARDRSILRRIGSGRGMKFALLDHARSVGAA